MYSPEVDRTWNLQSSPNWDYWKCHINPYSTPWALRNSYPLDSRPLGPALGHTWSKRIHARLTKPWDYDNYYNPSCVFLFGSISETNHSLGFKTPLKQFQLDNVPLISANLFWFKIMYIHQKMWLEAQWEYHLNHGCVRSMRRSF
jgi:hypothetical protein